MSHFDEVTLDTPQQKKNRRLVVILLALWLATLAGLVGVGWNAYWGEKEKNLTLSEQIDAACQEGELGQDVNHIHKEGLSIEEEERLCQNAAAVLEENDPEFQDTEIQEAEIQELEIQEQEIQDLENQNAEDQEAEEQDSENQDPEIQDSEIQEKESDDPDPNDPDPTDDPDPASPYDFTFTFTVPGDENQPDTTYTVTCNSGTGNCTVQQS